MATFTYGRGIAGRQLPNQPLPDHGKQQYDTDTFHGGNYATPHPQYYRNTALVPEKAPDHPGYDVLADVVPAAHKRGMKVICWFEDVLRYTSAIAAPGFEKVREVVLSGPESDFACSRNPSTRNFWLGLVEDYLRSYDVDGLMWGSERQGPLGNVLVTNHGGAGAGGRLACFCPYCIDAAKKDGINVDRAKAGYTKLASLGGGGRPRSEAGRRRVRHVLAAARAVSGDPRVGAAVERVAQRHLSRHVQALARDRAVQGHRLARVAQQHVLAVLSRGAGLRGVQRSTRTSSKS